MADDWCEVMDMPKLGCAHCRPPAERRRLDRLAVELDRKGGNTAPPREVLGKGAFTGAVTLARYPGRCTAGCGEPIEIGQEITKTDDDWTHLDCT